MCNGSPAKPKITGSSLEIALGDVYVPATGNSLAWKSVALEIPSSPSGVCIACLIHLT